MPLTRPQLTLQESTSSRVAGSSPIAPGRTDSRPTVKAFFTWLIEHAEDEVKDEYERARDSSTRVVDYCRLAGGKEHVDACQAVPDLRN